jgi:hypothetical protein
MTRHAFWLILLAILSPAVGAGVDANAPGGSRGPATQPAGKAGDSRELSRPQK